MNSPVINSPESKIVLSIFGINQKKTKPTVSRKTRYGTSGMIATEIALQSGALL